MFGVTPASQELVQPPIYLSKPASDAGLSKFGWKAQRIHGAFITLIIFTLFPCAQTKKDPPIPACRGPVAPTQNLSAYR